MASGVDAIQPVPADRAALRAAADKRAIPGWGGFLSDAESFDARFFHFSGREAASTDPQGRLFLEVAWEALEDGAQRPDGLRGKRVGVYVGVVNADFQDVSLPKAVSLYNYVNTSPSAVSGRLAYSLGFEGPAVSIDTACSSSLVAVMQACESLDSGATELAIAGGVNLVLIPEISMVFARAGMLAPDGRCKAFDARGDGFVRSDGVAAVVLKRLSKAIEDGDPIRAVLRGWGANHDGDTGQYKTPNVRGQMSLLESVYARAGLDLGSVQYVETHGTGTRAGDPVEANALAAVLGRGRTRENPLRLGSIKTNIGHTEGASGVAGLIKVVLALQHRTLPPALHFREPTPAIAWDKLPIQVVTQLEEWPAPPGEARAGVNSFGITGVNCHVVVEEAPARRTARARRSEAPAPRLNALVVSGHSKEALLGNALQYRDALQAGGPELAQDLCYTAVSRRAHHVHRAVVLGSPAELVDGLGALAAGTASPLVRTSQGPAEDRPGVTFVFSGQGAQWFGMGQRLLREEEAFARELQRCDEAIRAEAGFSVIEQLLAAEGESRLKEIDILQPTLFAIQCSLVALWRSWGVEPAAVIGHSMGEVAACHTAGILTLADAAKVICRRSRLMRRLRGCGAMLAVELDRAAAEQRIAGMKDKVSLAVISSPKTTVLSGATEIIEQIAAELEAQSVFCGRIKVDVASHSPQMDAIRDELLEALADLRPQIGPIPVHSTVVTGFGTRPEDGPRFDASYWWQNLRQPVLFLDAVRGMKSRKELFVEISPHPLLCQAVVQSHPTPDRALALPSMRRDEDERLVMLQSLGDLYLRGAKVDWSRVVPAGEAVPLPRYSWQHDRFPIEYPDHSTSRKPPFLQGHIQPVKRPQSHYWDVLIDPSEAFYLQDHKVQGEIVFPAAAFLDLILSAAREAFPAQAVRLEDVAFLRAFFLKEGKAAHLQLALQMASEAAGTIRIYDARAEGGTSSTPALLVQARLSLSARPPERNPLDLALVKSRCRQQLPATELYSAFERVGLNYGPHFRGIEELRLGEREALGTLQATMDVAWEAGLHIIHPALLDAAFQVACGNVIHRLVDSEPGTVYLPVKVQSITLLAQDGGRPRWVHARVSSEASAASGLLEVDLLLLDEEGRSLLAVRGLRIAEVGARRANREKWLHQHSWVSQPLSVPTVRVAEPSAYCVLVDGRGIGDRVADLLVRQGRRVIRINRAMLAHGDREGMERLIERLGALPVPLRGIVHCWGLDLDAPPGAPAGAVSSAASELCMDVVHLVQALNVKGLHPQLCIVTEGTQQPTARATVASAIQSAVWGLARVIAVEHPELQCRRIDLGSSEDAAALFAEIQPGQAEDEVALRGRERWVARIVRSAASGAPASAPLLAPAAGRSFRVETLEVGSLDALQVHAFGRPQAGPGEVVIEVAAAALNFRDVLRALGNEPGQPARSHFTYGDECAGRIVEVGHGVEGLHVGQEVIAQVLTRCMASHVVARETSVWPKPANLTLEQAAATVIAYGTAYFSLVHTASVEKGERVLIHSAAGGVGFAAVNLCRWLGAEVFATAGSPEKRALLEEMGVKHVLDSRTLAFADQIMERTGGQGVDVVLSAVTGPAAGRSLELLRRFGRFIEIGKKPFYDGSDLDLSAFRRNLSYFAIDLTAYIAEKPSLWHRVVAECLALLAEGKLPPLPHKVFPARDVQDAFRFMARAQHVGKIVLDFSDKDTPIARPAEVIQGDATYLITGGLSGLGLSFAEWMAAQGAQFLVLMGRRPPGAEAQRAIERLGTKGVTVHVALADVGDFDQLAGVFRQIKETMPPLRGVIHSAGVLADGIVLRLGADSFTEVFGPKVKGAWNLHRLTESEQLDFFVLFSSGAGLFGSPGQGNYAAANAFVDGLARLRRTRGLPALSVQWGRWSEIGMAARADLGKRLSQQGWGSIAPAEGVALLPRLLELQGDGAEIAVMPFDLASWEQSHAAVKKLTIFDALRQGARGSSEDEPSQLSILDRLKQTAAAPAREELMTAHLRERVAGVIKLAEDKIDVGSRLITLGFDSLMSIELRNKLESDLGMSVPVSSLLRGPTLRELAGLLLQKLAKVAPPVEAPAPAAPAAAVAPEPPRPMSRPTIPILPRARRGVSNG